MLYIAFSLADQLMLSPMMDLDRPRKGLDCSKCSFLRRLDLTVNHGSVRSFSLDTILYPFQYSPRHQLKVSKH